MSSDTKLDANLGNWLSQINALSARQQEQGMEMTPVTARESLGLLTASFVRHKPEISRVCDTLVDNGDYPVPVRIYDPAPKAEKAVCLFCHGGGHMAGSVSVYDPICRKIAEASGQLVVSVEYRRAPECPYPQGLNDCLGTARNLWSTLARKNCHVRQQLFLVGDSAGGALAATVSALAQEDAKLAIDKQVLIYPSLDYTLACPSVDQNGVGYLLEKSRIKWYFDEYFQHGEERHAVSPLHMPITNRLPQTLVVSAGFCPLRDEAFAYVKQLRTAGVSCEHRHFGSLIHAYLNLENMVRAECASTYGAIGAFLQA